MNTMKWMMPAAVVVSMTLSLVGCGGQPSDNGQQPKSMTQNLGPNNEFYGSDTLKEVLVASNVQSSAGLTIEGKGSGVGEGCLRNGSSPYCIGRQQTLAPMSRDFKAGTCSGGTASSGACCPGESSNAVALDAVNAFVRSTTYSALPNNSISTADLKKVFCGDGTGSAATCVSNWSALGRPTAGTLAKYRRDDLSGTTDTFKSLVGCTTFCSDVTVVLDESSANPAACATTDSATVCIGKLAASNSNAIGYAGDSARRTGNTALQVNGIAPTPANVRKLLASNPTGVYPLSRKLFLNENVNYTKTAQEQALYDWVYSTNTQDFENLLVEQGFIACSDISPLDCGGDLGRGSGVCQGL
ncbi:substrate-binding domain-containing protein [Stigmatella sp. ncwal1]|uniref:Substrate-binding domain-containing protein n=1 Tax=Stigmatella ashevillensis TaxID=2995309 RepID=A0ABT5DDU0_9BACT|nr:substrate-binding domain-containing protein [Stigmatella ashevillena]MDC0711788.1 substrate-binding domain-containing protein [Stigmatella ashevillena]